MSESVLHHIKDFIFGEDHGEHGESSVLTLNKLLNASTAADITKFPLKQWDHGIFSAELLKQNLTPNSSSKGIKQLEQGTYGGTQLAITELYSRTERAFSSYMEALGVERPLPQKVDLKAQQEAFQWEGGLGVNDEYPPHLKSIPTKDQVSAFQIFNVLGLVETQLVLSMMIPKTFIQKIEDFVIDEVVDCFAGDPYQGPTIRDCEKYNNSHHRTGTDIMRGENIGNFPDWYSDARFAEQQLTGNNPTSLKLAGDWTKGFKEQAAAQKLDNMVDLLGSTAPEDMYVQDCSYFREAIGVGPEDMKGMTTSDDWGTRYECAAVSLFRLHSDGQLHPLGIVIDWKGSWAKSVTIFNKRLIPDASTANEEDDWPWRYAKTCAQVSDWAVHEITAHLTDTHMVEEATIVATNRTIPQDHIIFKLLSPHWFRTLSLNAAARHILMPEVISKLVGFSSEGNLPDAFAKHAYGVFDWEKRYVPNDLRDRGFPPQKLETDKFRNCGYAKCAILMWGVLHHFVQSMIDLYYASDDAVVKDPYIKSWCDEIKVHGMIKGFPDIQTKTQLIDSLTMCIHLASPQHTAVNYLQNFYQAFVISKPPALCAPMPTSLNELKSYTEAKFTAALPIGDKHAKLWLLAAQLPYLLSWKVADELNIVNYAKCLWDVNKAKKDIDENGVDPQKVKLIARRLYNNLHKLDAKMDEYNRRMTKGTLPYTVLKPDVTAVSILI